MTAVSLSEPLCQPCAYDSRFKVEVYLKEPLMSIHLSPEQVALDMLCLCSQLDLLIRAQVHQGQTKLDLNPEESEAFQNQGAEIINQMKQCLENSPKPAPLLEDYLDIAGLSMIFPRVEVYVIHGSPVDMLEEPAMDGYFSHLGRLNQLLGFSQQLDNDVKHIRRHKYIPHQLAVVHQGLNSFKDVVPLSAIKKDIEANFKSLKMSLVAEEGSEQEPQLPAQYISWVSQVTQSIISAITSLPEELTDELNPVMAFVSELS
ncbi:uncharacterized protein si:ch211-218d20.15 [Silurus meridionalis]|uniref:Uncharacterized protein n=1 Tax=Silurus meridionalis TaxID=175797 RepID=A0A8T0BVH6_SILME|nr:uncharacterized protein si:ch211-218d20.15 [Silurus meridionalis]KAF7709466.1 hypothetical protein HF521_016316 [Silurus meridionalis]